ncbi:MAG: hypothetical protein M1364_02395 [Candidatus Marsarchaeota archaeon]|jgi:hypothetical protein|nr:hypothetical protein [Candidatus Marsarchaeota archaeon]
MAASKGMKSGNGARRAARSVKDANQKHKSAKAQEVPESENSSNIKYIAAFGIIIIVLAFAGAIVYGVSNSNAQTPFSVFQKNFNTANAVNIYIVGNNGTAISSTSGCATAIIQAIEFNATHRRNSSTISFFALNQTGCVYLSGLGKAAKNYTYSSASACIKQSASKPSIFINYSVSNSTVIKPDTFYLSGDARYLAECGISGEIS